MDLPRCGDIEAQKFYAFSRVKKLDAPFKHHALVDTPSVQGRYESGNTVKLRLVRATPQLIGNRLHRRHSAQRSMVHRDAL